MKVGEQVTHARFGAGSVTDGPNEDDEWYIKFAGGEEGWCPTDALALFSQPTPEPIGRPSVAQLTEAFELALGPHWGDVPSVLAEVAADVIDEAAAPTPEHTIEEYAEAFGDGLNDGDNDLRDGIRAVLALAGVKIADEPERPAALKVGDKVTHPNEPGNIGVIKHGPNERGCYVLWRLAKHDAEDVDEWIAGLWHRESSLTRWEPASPATPEPETVPERCPTCGDPHPGCQDRWHIAPAAPESPTVTVELSRDVARRLMLDKRSERLTSDVDAVASACRAALRDGEVNH
jgi:hypothetical protein